MITQKELDEIEHTLLALRKTADIGLNQVEQLRAALPRLKKEVRRKAPSTKYKTLILGGSRATKKVILNQ